MEKTTKKKKSKRLKRRIGLIAVGGLSLVLTVCLSVGATLAWFAGTTWASNDLYMGGPVYVEMTGRAAGNSTGWVGGNGQLDILASGRSTGTAKSGITSSGSATAGDYTTDNVLLPGQKLLIYSQARVYSNAFYSTEQANEYLNKSSGAVTSNTTNGTAQYVNNGGKKKTTTTSVLRAKFSIDIEFDPTVGFNNFTDDSYANNYPDQSKPYTGSTVKYTKDSDGNINDVSETYHTSGLTWESALVTSKTGRRDEVLKNTTGGSSTQIWSNSTDTTDLTKIKAGELKSVYKWKYVSYDIYKTAGDEAGDDKAKTTGMIKMAKPFDGSVNTAGADSANVSGGTGNGFYGVWIADSNGQKTESDAFYKARTEAYLQSYVEHIVTSDQTNLLLSIRDLGLLESALNESFVDLVNQSSDNIIEGNVKGFTADSGGSMTYYSGGTATSASWLYVDPTIGNDTNASDSATSVGGWWYLVENANSASVSSGKNEVKSVYDYIDGVSSGTTGSITYDWDNGKYTSSSKVVTKSGGNIIRKDLIPSSGYTGSTGSVILDSDNNNILSAKLFEITPDANNGAVEEIGTGNGTYKVVSVSFPFVNGNFELPGKELTNNFANAKITFKITFQALQAFLPYTQSIDGCPKGSAVAGLGKALNIYNAIPVFNEAFDYLSYLDTAL